MPCKNPCAECAQIGLPILFTRYGVGYSTTAREVAALDALRPAGRFKAQPGNVALQQARYNLRMLRAGYLYIRLESECRLPEWLAFTVHPHGYLTRFNHRHPQDASSQPSCRPREWGAHRSLVWIRDAEAVSHLHYLFHPDPIDPQHLRSVIGMAPDKYMQRFDVSAWVRGQKTAPESGVPVADTRAWNVAEFKALHDEATRHALEPQLYGLMGSSVPERGWGRYEELGIAPRIVKPSAGLILEERVVHIPRDLGDYADAHGPRLRGIASELSAQGGAILACEDPIGIAQELGHLQAEAQTAYTRWQLAQAPGAAPGVNNLWLYQTALGAQSLNALLKKGAVQKTLQRSRAWDAMLDRMEANDALLAGRDPTLLERQAETRAVARANQQQEMAAAQATGDEEFRAHFDNAGAAAALEAQRLAYEKNSTALAQLGIDQTAWLDAPRLALASRCYSDQDDAIGRPGGGAALSIQLASCMAGCETNSVGQAWLDKAELFGDNVLAKTLSFNNKTVQQRLAELARAAERQALPAAEPGAWADTLTTSVLKPYAANFALGDKAIAFAEDPGAIKRLSESTTLRVMAWPAHIASLLSVKMMRGVNGLPVSKVEARVLQYTALTGLSTVGSAAKSVAEGLSRTAQKRNEYAEKKIMAAAPKLSASGLAVSASRSAGLGAVFDIGGAVVKGAQLSMNPDGRTGVEMVGSLLQGIGSLADFRAKAYEATIYSGARGVDFYKMKVYREAVDELQMATLRKLRVTAFKFLLPAAAIGVFWDGVDALRSFERGNKWLYRAQVASAVGSVLTVGASLAGILSLTGKGAMMLSPAAWASIGCVLGLVGALLTIAAVVGICWLSVPKWTEWLQDCPLSKQNKGKPPRHENLKETLQKLANAFDVDGLDAAGVPG